MQLKIYACVIILFCNFCSCWLSEKGHHEAVHFGSNEYRVLDYYDKRSGSISLGIYIKECDIKKNNSSILSIVDCIMYEYKDEIKKKNGDQWIYLQVYDANYDDVEAIEGYPSFGFTMLVHDDGYSIEKVSANLKDITDEFKERKRKMDCIIPVEK